MVSLDKAVVVKYSKAGKHFEVFVDPNLAEMFREGQKKDFNNVLVVEEVFVNARKGDRAKASDLMEVFGTTDVYEIGQVIVKEGEFHLTTEQRRRKVEEKRRQIVAILSREAIDPRTKAPHPEVRIIQALEKAKVHIDPFKDAREQIPSIVKQLKLVLPLSFETVSVAVRIPPQYAGRVYGFLKNYTIKREEWASTGHLMAIVEIPAGAQGEFFDKLNKLTHGDNETRMLSD
jgi:ribosome maturation protein SDO1